MFIKLAFALVLTVPAWPHHSVAAVYDSSKLETFKGVVASGEWTNPHAYVLVDVKSDSGEITR